MCYGAKQLFKTSSWVILRIMLDNFVGFDLVTFILYLLIYSGSLDTVGL